MASSILTHDKDHNTQENKVKEGIDPTSPMIRIIQKLEIFSFLIWDVLILYGIFSDEIFSDWVI